MSNEVKLPFKAKAPAPDMARKPETIYVSLETRKAFSVERGEGGWVFVTVTYNDDGSIFTIEKSQPDVKPIIIEKFKLAALRNWQSIG